jgi:hypothetical protein
MNLTERIKLYMPINYYIENSHLVYFVLAWEKLYDYQALLYNFLFFIQFKFDSNI